MKKPTPSAHPEERLSPSKARLEGSDQTPAQTSEEVASIASELLALEPIDIVRLGTFGAPSVDDFLTKVKSVAASALRQAGQ